MDFPRFYERNLPHWQPEGEFFAVQFSLAGSLPKSKIQELKAERDLKLNSWKQKEQRLKQKFPEGLSLELLKELETAKHEIANRYKGKFNALLDGAAYGPTWLRDQEVAKVVQNAIHYAEEELSSYTLWAYCIMPNHVHMVLSDVEPVLHHVLGSIKKYSGRIANQMIGRSGQPFWHRESYDHIIRSSKEFEYQVAYVLNNPVKAGLVKHWADWPFSYVKE